MGQGEAMRPLRGAGMDEAVTRDAILGGRVTLLQPASGYRAAIDPVFLAASVAARPGQRVLDAGCGVGAAMLCLAARVVDCTIAGIELDPETSELARRNIDANGAAGRCTVVAGSLLAAPAALGEAGFDHVMTNPPFLAEGTPPRDGGRRLAHMESEAGLAAWIDACLAQLRPGGALTLIHRADRLGELLDLLGPRVGAISVYPLWPMRDRPARRILVHASKDAPGPARFGRGLVLHEPDGRYTGAADAILRDAQGIEI